ncbi:MAG: 50S ribosomal protein L18 [Deltaproteobacteria bacterium]|nr:50S ribosomal protein L18 [Deltaproteobacteria bacterium]
MAGKVVKLSSRDKRRIRVSKKVRLVPGRPRINVFRSNKHIFAQVIDDMKGTTIASASTVSKDMKSKTAKLNKTDAAKVIGEHLGKQAKEKGVSKVVFDRAGYLYHGRVKALADGLREAGLKF